MTSNRRRRKRGGLLIGLAVLVLFIGVAAAAVSILKVGVLAGLALAGAGFTVYAVPAAFLGWPLPTLNDIIAFVVGILGGIVSLVRSLFD